jgi:hypothetical protein
MLLSHDDTPVTSGYLPAKGIFQTQKTALFLDENLLQQLVSGVYQKTIEAGGEFLYVYFSGF